MPFSLCRDTAIVGHSLLLVLSNPRDGFGFFFFPENIDFRLQVPWAKGKKLPINRRIEIRITIFVLNSFLYR